MTFVDGEPTEFIKKTNKLHVDYFSGRGEDFRISVNIEKKLDIETIDYSKLQPQGRNKKRWSFDFG